ncbi:MAG: hypothetical protein ACQBVK_02350, partial [Candidatus Phytoplasma sp. TWB_XP]
KEKIKETEELKNYDLGEEYYLYLQKNPQKLKKFYKQICEILTMNKDKFISMNIESKVRDIKKNIRQSKNNARMKAIFNFSNEEKISWLTLTLSHHNNNGTISKDVKDLLTTKKLVKKIITKLRNRYIEYLNKQNLKNIQLINI